MAWYWWLLASVMFSCVLMVIIGILGLFHRPDFEIEDHEEYEMESGVINVKANNKAQHDLDLANGVREQTDDGA
jgi:hypothetical protein